MSFQNGPITFRMFFLDRDIKKEDISFFRERVLPSLETLTNDEISGWVGNRHLLDRVINEQSAYLGGYLSLSLTKATKKVPKSLLDAEVAIEEFAVMEAEKKDYLRQAERRKIKQAVEAELLPEMPPQLKGIDFVFDQRTHILYCSATTIKQIDAFVTLLQKTTGIVAKSATPERLAQELEQVNAFDWIPTNFSTKMNDLVVDGIGATGRDFLLWLWFCSEMRGGIANIPVVGEVAYMIEGPLTLELEAIGAFETTLRKGDPIHGSEVRTALQSAKKPKKTKVKFVSGKKEWEFTLDADDFVFRGLKLPETEAFDRIGKFQERMILLDTFRVIFTHLFREYVRERKDAQTWEETVDTIRKWINTRPVV